MEPLSWFNAAKAQLPKKGFRHNICCSTLIDIAEVKRLGIILPDFATTVWFRYGQTSIYKYANP